MHSCAETKTFSLFQHTETAHAGKPTVTSIQHILPHTRDMARKKTQFIKYEIQQATQYPLKPILVPLPPPQHKYQGL